MNNKFDKFKRFIKKEGFYVILFVCLCTVATVATITATKSNDDKTTVVVQDTNNKTADQLGEGALQVKENLKPVPNVKKDSGTKAVSNSIDKSFVNPVDGSLGRAYSEDLQYWKTTQSHKNHLAMDIKAKEGSIVKAAADGVVKSVGKDTEGIFVEIDHQNGLITLYGNLQEKVSVKQGDKIKSSQEIGKVGNTTNFAYETYGTYLHFKVLKDGKEVDPAKYVSYKK